MLGLVASAIGEAGGTIGSVDLIDLDDAHTLRDITVDTAGIEHGEAIVAASTGSTARRSSTPPTGRSCCTWAGRSSSATRHR